MPLEKKPLDPKNRRRRHFLFAIALAALLALPAYAADAAPSLWERLVAAVTQLFGDDPEGGLSIEPGG